MAGQALGLPITMGLYSFIGVAVTSAAFVIYPNLSPEQKQNLWDPIFLLSLFPNKVVLIFAMCFAWRWRRWRPTLPRTSLAPPTILRTFGRGVITFRIGGFITGVIGILIQPWRLLANASVYIGKWLVGYSSLLGAVGGVLIADYFVIRRTRPQSGRPVRERTGPTGTSGGFNLLAMIALLVGIGLCVPGFLATVGVVALTGDTSAAADIPRISDLWGHLYSYAWFTSFGTSFVLYVLLMKIFGKRPVAS